LEKDKGTGIRKSHGSNVKRIINSTGKSVITGAGGKSEEVPAPYKHEVSQ
jgi:hypothetical protein